MKQNSSFLKMLFIVLLFVFLVTMVIVSVATINTQIEKVKKIDVIPVGDIQNLKELIFKKGSVRLIDEYLTSGGTIEELLYETTKRNNVQIMQYILSKYNVKDFEKNKGAELLLVSLNVYAFDISKYLIEKGVDVNTKDEFGDTPLVIIMDTNDLTQEKKNLISILKKRGADNHYAINKVAQNKEKIKIERIEIEKERKQQQLDSKKDTDKRYLEHIRQEYSIGASYIDYIDTYNNSINVVLNTDKEFSNEHNSYGDTLSWIHMYLSILSCGEDNYFSASYTGCIYDPWKIKIFNRSGKEVLYFGKDFDGVGQPSKYYKPEKYPSLK
jgi:hypothetical protein